MSVMFANAPANQRSATGFLVEFKAGKTAIEQGSTPALRKIVPDKTKGTVFIKQSQDQLMHFCWKNRETGAVDIDLIIFPGDTEFIPIKECKDGRVYLLKFKSGGDRKLFWMQEPKPDKDEEICKKVNELLNNPPALRSTAGRSNEKQNAFGNLANLSGALGNGEDMGAFSNMDQNQLMQLLSLMNSGGAAESLLPQLALNSGNAATRESPSATPPPRAAQGTTANKPTAQGLDAAIQLAQLRDILSGIPAATSRQQRNVVDLSQVLSTKNVRESVLENKDRLLNHLPEVEPIKKNEEELRETLSSPQFRQSVDSFGHAFQTGQLAPALQQFNVGESAVTAANSGDLLDFSKKLTETEQKDEKKEAASSSAKSEESTETVVEPKPKRGKKDDGNGDMDLD